MSLFNLLGPAKTINIEGTELTVPKLTLLDIAEIEGEFGFDLLEDMGGDSRRFLRAIMWHVLRQNDTRLTDKQKESRNFQLTQAELDAILPLSFLTSAKGQKTFAQIIAMCGIGNEDSAEEAKSSEGSTPSEASDPKNE